MKERGTAVNFFKDVKVNIGYYKASVTSLNGFKYGKGICLVCNTEQKLFSINPNRNPNPESICINCLAIIDIEAFHDTKHGFVGKDIPIELVDEDAMKIVKKEYYEEMLKTPYYTTYQGEQWMCHCENFMDYIGIWDAPDFTKESGNDNGKELFEEMTISGYHHLWDEFDLKVNEKNESWEDALYHAFQCRHCKIKQGYWEH